MGQFLSSTFWEGSPAAVWQEKLREGERKGAGETIPILQDHVICSEEREHGSKHHEVHIIQRLLFLRSGSWWSPGCGQQARLKLCFYHLGAIDFTVATGFL